jgi:hypothetical protein
MNAWSSRLVTFGLPLWALVTVALAPLPVGVGGWPRAVNAVAFMLLGPGIAMTAILVRLVDPTVAGVIAMAGSLTVLVLSSQALLVLHMWAPWRVAVLVAAVTIALALAPVRSAMQSAAIRTRRTSPPGGKASR